MMTQNELKKILELHKKWLNDDEDGERADLHDAYLSGADLRNADLHHADLYYADLRGAIIAWGLACPETGSFEAWKKVVDKNGTEFFGKTARSC